MNILIIGESGTGKSASIRNLDHATTLIINVLGKPLPFPGWKSKYTLWTKEEQGNLVVTDTAIVPYIRNVSASRPEIKTLIIDDFQYVMANEFMRRASEKGFEKFTEIGKNAWNILKASGEVRDDLNVIFMAHSEVNDSGKVKCKTIGRMLDEKITIEGMFTMVLKTVVTDGQYMFSTQNNGADTVKVPMGMFGEELIENDLQMVIETIKKYEEQI